MTVCSPTERITVMQGQAFVAARSNAVLTTVLGSCVACCLFDAEAAIGGMNHFLLAEPRGSSIGRVDEHYGAYLMEVLINDMLGAGASKERLRAHLYGGANLHAGMQRIGSANAEFARDFLRREAIPLSFADLGGERARRVEFLAARGRARCRQVDDLCAAPEKPMPRPTRASGDVELF